MKLKDFATINMGQSPKGETYNTDGNGMPFLQGRKTFGRIYPTIDTKVMNNVICFFVSLSINMLCILHFAIIFGFNKDNIGFISLLLL